MNSTIFVGLDVRKATVSVAVAEGRRDGEVRHLGTFKNFIDVLTKLPILSRPRHSWHHVQRFSGRLGATAPGWQRIDVYGA
jgi:hypothetical protein